MNADGRRYERQTAAVGHQLSARTHISGIRVIRGPPCRSYQCYQCNPWSDVAVRRIAKRTQIGECRLANSKCRMNTKTHTVQAASVLRNEPSFAEATEGKPRTVAFGCQLSATEDAAAKRTQIVTSPPK